MRYMILVYDFHTLNVTCDHGKTRKLDVPCTSSIKNSGYEYERYSDFSFENEYLFLIGKCFSCIPIYFRVLEKKDRNKLLYFKYV